MLCVVCVFREGLLSRSLREEVMVWSVTDKDDGWDVQQALHTPLLDRYTLSTHCSAAEHRYTHGSTDTGKRRA
jgi:hypothetical protein